MNRRLTISNLVPYMLTLFTVSMIGMFAVVKFQQAILASASQGVEPPIMFAILATMGFDGLFLTFAFVLLRNAQVGNKWAAGVAIASIAYMCWANNYISVAGIPPDERIARYMMTGAITIAWATANFIFTMTGKGRAIDDGIFDESRVKFNVPGGGWKN